jgi:peptidoglycan/xylan/chitin deacetylase (PgdA/CDA1 family)
MAVSSDGRWVLYIEPTSDAFGNLMLLDLSGGRRLLIAARVERPEKHFPASWSPDSRFFIYARENKLYYRTVNNTQDIDEGFRLIGSGAINSIKWGRGSDFYYLKGSVVYWVRGSEVPVRSFYTDFLEIGRLIGKIPFEFDPNFDAFWVAPNSRSLLFAKGGRSLFYYPLDFDEYADNYDNSWPYLMLPRSCFLIDVLWSAGGMLTVITAAPGITPEAGGSAGKGELSLFKLNTWEEKGMAFEQLDFRFEAGALSPNGTRALFWGGGGAVLYDYTTLRPLVTVTGRPVYSCIWTADDEIIIGDDLQIGVVRFLEAAADGGMDLDRRLICLSSAAAFGFEDEGSRILVKNDETWFATDGVSPWEVVYTPQVRNPSQASGRYRVYLEDQPGGIYENLPMIRNTATVGTAALLPGGIPSLPPILSNVAPSLPEQPVTPGFFQHGIRTGIREVALCFDLYDDDAGLAETLDALRRFNVRATFFLNGEFIRRHPLAAAAVAMAGHESASMFFAPIDLSASRYHPSDEFITRGLARNEDEFYQATGRELTVFWHPPFYAASPEIIASAFRVGYRTIGRDIDPMDWVGKNEERKIGIPQYSASEMVDRIMQSLLPGSIIPIRIGILPGGRTDYLFGRINVLLDALVRSGYQIVPVSLLMEHAK